MMWHLGVTLQSKASDDKNDTPSCLKFREISSVVAVSLDLDLEVR